MVLVSVVVITAFSYYPYIGNFSIKADNYTAATHFLVETVEILLSCDYNDPSLSLTAGQPPPYDFHYDPLPECNLKNKYVAVRQYTVDELQWDSTFADSLYKTITVSISWNDGASRILSLTARKTKL